jgi:hypothetical protein
VQPLVLKVVIQPPLLGHAGEPPLLQLQTGQLRLSLNCSNQSAELPPVYPLGQLPPPGMRAQSASEGWGCATQITFAPQVLDERVIGQKCSEVPQAVAGTVVLPPCTQLELTSVTESTSSKPPLVAAKLLQLTFWAPVEKLYEVCAEPMLVAALQLESGPISADIEQVMVGWQVQLPQPEGTIRFWCSSRAALKSVGHGLATGRKIPIWLPNGTAGVQATRLLHVGSWQSARLSPLLSMPSRQSLSGMRTQLGATHWKLGWQSASPLQLVKQAPALQANPFWQAPAPAEQPPAPSQVPLHEAPQTVVAGG